MAALKNEVKSFIVQALACFDTPSQVSQAVKQEFDVDVTRQQVEQHDPTKRAGSHLALKWQTLFHDTRKRFREETAEIPIANGGQQVSADLDYYHWLQQQPAAFQDVAIGPVRAKLFREGGLTVERFAELQLDRNFAPLTLAQMKGLEPLAFERAGLV